MRRRTFEKRTCIGNWVWSDKSIGRRILWETKIMNANVLRSTVLAVNVPVLSNEKNRVITPPERVHRCERNGYILLCWGPSTLQKYFPPPQKHLQHFWSSRWTNLNVQWVVGETTHVAKITTTAKSSIRKLSFCGVFYFQTENNNNYPFVKRPAKFAAVEVF